MTTMPIEAPTTSATANHCWAVRTSPSTVAPMIAPAAGSMLSNTPRLCAGIDLKHFAPQVLDLNHLTQAAGNQRRYIDNNDFHMTSYNSDQGGGGKMGIVWVVALLLSGQTPFLPPLQQPERDAMERTIAPYWSQNIEVANLRRKSDSPEAQIYQYHERSLPVSYTEKSNRVRRELEVIVDRAIGKNRAYKRITCSIVTCEIVLVFPNIDGDGPLAPPVMATLYNDLHKKNDMFYSAGPAMVLEGSNTENGMSMLYFVDIR